LRVRHIYIKDYGKLQNITQDGLKLNKADTKFHENLSAVSRFEMKQADIERKIFLDIKRYIVSME